MTRETVSCLNALDNGELSEAISEESRHLGENDYFYDYYRREGLCRICGYLFEDGGYSDYPTMASPPADMCIPCYLGVNDPLDDEPDSGSDSE